MYPFNLDKDGSNVTTVVANPCQGPDRPLEVSYTDTMVIGNGSFGVVYRAKLCDTGETVAIKKVLQDKRFKVSTMFLNVFNHLSSSLVIVIIILTIYVNNTILVCFKCFK